MYRVSLLEVGSNASQEWRALYDQAVHSRHNALASYNPKAKEFCKYCQAKFSNDDICMQLNKLLRRNSFAIYFQAY
jgi:hypothetical protein